MEADIETHGRALGWAQTLSDLRAYSGQISDDSGGGAVSRLLLPVVPPGSVEGIVRMVQLGAAHDRRSIALRHSRSRCLGGDTTGSRNHADSGQAQSADGRAREAELGSRQVSHGRARCRARSGTRDSTGRGLRRTPPWATALPRHRLAIGRREVTEHKQYDRVMYLSQPAPEPTLSKRLCGPRSNRSCRAP